MSFMKQEMNTGFICLRNYNVSKGLFANDENLLCNRGKIVSVWDLDENNNLINNRDLAEYQEHFCLSA